MAEIRAVATDNPHLTGWFTHRRMDADATRAGKCRPHASVLPTESELRNECPVTLNVVPPEVIQQATATTDEHQQATTAVMVLLVELQMLRQVVDTPREERNLYLRRTGVGPVEAMLSDCCSGIGHAKTKILRVAEAENVPRAADATLFGERLRGSAHGYGWDMASTRVTEARPGLLTDWFLTVRERGNSATEIDRRRGNEKSWTEGDRVQ